MKIAIYLARPRRNKMEICYDILDAILEEEQRFNFSSNRIKPSRIQLRSNLSFDKLVRYLNELENNGMILQNPINITEKGRDFLSDYNRISGFLLEMGIKYMSNTTLSRLTDVGGRGSKSL